MPNCLHEALAENCRNLRSIRPKTSRYKGVHWQKRCKKWTAQISCNNKTYHLGYLKDEIEATRAYDAKATELFRQFAYLNLGTAKD